MVSIENSRIMKLLLRGLVRLVRQNNRSALNFLRIQQYDLKDRDWILTKQNKLMWNSKQQLS